MSAVPLLLQTVWNYLRPQADDNIPTKTAEQLAAEGSTAWSAASLFYSEERKYNPDDLLGRAGYLVYNKMMLDEQVKSAVQFRRGSVTGRDWYFELDAEQSGLGEEEAQRRVDIYTKMIEDGSGGYRGSFIDGLNIVMKALWQGFSFSEKMFDFYEVDGKNYIGLAKLRPKPYETFIVEANEFGDVIRWVQVKPGTGQERTVDMEKFVYFVNAPDEDEHYGRSELRSAHRAWFAKDFTIRFMNIFNERLAGGFVVCRPSDGAAASPLLAGSPAYANLVNTLKNINLSTSMLLPAGYEIEVHYAPGTQINSFLSAVEFQDLAIAKSLLIPNLLGMSSPKAQTGSFSQGNVHFDIFIMISDGDARRLAEACNEQIFKPLAMPNFGDDIAPKLCFKPLSEAKKLQLLDVWQNLVSGKAVQASDTDEAHVRDLLEFPEKGEPLSDPAADLLPQDPSSQLPPGRADPRQRDRVSPDQVSETLTGRTLKAYTRKELERASKRVAFTVVERQMEQEHARAKIEIEDALAELVSDGVARIAEASLGSDPRTAEQIGRFDFSGLRTQVLHTALRRALRAAMDVGRKHSLSEIDLAKSERFSKKIDLARLGDLAAEWLKSKALNIASDLRGGSSKAIKEVLMNGLKYNWTQKEIKQNVYKALVSKGYLTGATAADALGVGDSRSLAEQLDIQGDMSAARLDTIIRTTTYEAMNESRFDVFTDPAMDGFVQAMTYSAILDGRTTDVCRHMNDRTYSVDDWQAELRPWVPPNHFNCRSLLIPVTTVDEDVKLDEGRPRVEPQEGFG